MKNWCGLFIILILLININFISAQKYTLRVTEEHPFFVNNEWIPAKELKMGDNLLTEDGKKAKIISIKEIIDNIEVYNLEANPFNDFIVEGNVVVHNSDAPRSPYDNIRRFSSLQELETRLRNWDLTPIEALSRQVIINWANALLEKNGFPKLSPEEEIQLILAHFDIPVSRTLRLAEAGRNAGLPEEVIKARIKLLGDNGVFGDGKPGDGLEGPFEEVIRKNVKFLNEYANYLKETAQRQCERAPPFRASNDGTPRSKIFSDYFADLVRFAYKKGRYIIELNPENAPRVKELLGKGDVEGAKGFKNLIEQANEQINQLDMTNPENVQRARDILKNLYPDINSENLQKIIDALKQNQGLRVYAEVAANAIRRGVSDVPLTITIERPEGTFTITYNGIVTTGQVGSIGGPSGEELTLSAFPSELANFIAEKLSKPGKRIIALEVGRIATKLGEMNREDFFEMLYVMFTEVKKDLKLKIKEALRPEFAKKFAGKELDLQLELSAEQEFQKLNIVLVSVQNFGDAAKYKLILCRINGASKQGGDSLLGPPLTNKLRKDEFGRYWVQVTDSNGKVIGEIQYSVNIFYWRQIAEYIQKKWGYSLPVTDETLP